MSVYFTAFEMQSGLLTAQRRRDGVASPTWRPRGHVGSRAAVERWEDDRAMTPATSPAAYPAGRAVGDDLDVAPGTHTLQVRGTGDDGRPRVEELTIEALAASGSGVDDVETTADKGTRLPLSRAGANRVSLPVDGDGRSGGHDER